VGVIPAGGARFEWGQNSLWYELNAAESIHSMHKLAALNSMLGDFNGQQPAKFQPFPIRHTFIPRYMQFDLRDVAAQILGYSKRLSDEVGKNRLKFWSGHFHTHLKAFRRDAKGREFDGTLYTDGYGVSILKRHSESAKGSGQKRKRSGKNCPSSVRWPSLANDLHHLMRLSSSEQPASQRRPLIRISTPRLRKPAIVQIHSIPPTPF
jgi:hypothetical protein